MSELRKLLEEEKEIRIKYQNIVYKLCNIVDRRAGGKCTIDSVLATLTELLDSKPVRVAKPIYYADTVYYVQHDSREEIVNAVVLRPCLHYAVGLSAHRRLPRGKGAISLRQFKALMNAVKSMTPQAIQEYIQDGEMPVRVADGQCVDCKECASPCPMPSDVEVKIDSVHSGSKYLRRVTSPLNNEQCLVDVYAVLDAYRVESQPVGHAIKKLLMAGQRGAKDRKTDLQEAIDALQRAVQMEGGAE